MAQDRRFFPLLIYLCKSANSSSQKVLSAQRALIWLKGEMKWCLPLSLSRTPPFEGKHYQHPPWLIRKRTTNRKKAVDGASDGIWTRNHYLTSIQKSVDETADSVDSHAPPKQQLVAISTTNTQTQKNTESKNQQTSQTRRRCSVQGAFYYYTKRKKRTPANILSKPRQQLQPARTPQTNRTKKPTNHTNPPRRHT